MVRFEVEGCDVIRRSPHGDVIVAKCYTPSWAEMIAKLLNKWDQEN